MFARQLSVYGKTKVYVPPRMRELSQKLEVRQLAIIYQN